ncbi:hypothetical protein LAZ67_X000881 [Cordylochernes scorpioides]|uniref:DDE-1 domain-containing protein n=1 Tax=Cordylochernes scorpioides TaxID=51811 RepID=A0ABY6LRZ4_9ARAC|nr:hypothetical protein LAZ67_X000881 [Cordylochernes scorpioides]
MKCQQLAYKASKSRIAAMVCGNINGTHRLPSIIIEGSLCFANPRFFEGIKKLPVIYKKQKNSWMDSNISTEGYDTVFIPEVKKQQIATGKYGNVLLLIDNAPSHPSNISMERENGIFKKIIATYGSDGGKLLKNCTKLYKEIDLKKAFLLSEESITASEELPNSQFVSELAELITKSSPECDVNDPAYQLLTDDEIIESVVDDQGSSDTYKIKINKIISVTIGLHEGHANFAQSLILRIFLDIDPPELVDFFLQIFDDI